MRDVAIRAPLFGLLAMIGCGGPAGPGAAHAVPVGTDASVSDSAPRRQARIGENHGQLAESDPVNDGNARYHVWQVELEPSQRVRIWMLSDEIDPLIEVRGPGNQHLRNDDAFPGILNAMVDFVPQQPGTYEIWTTSYAAGQLGRYALRIEARGLEGVGDPIPLGGSVSAQLSPQARAGQPGAWLHFSGDEGSVVRLRVTSQAFDTIATLIGPGGQTWVNDDANDLGPGNSERALDSTIVAALPQSGIYQLVVTPYGSGGGAFNVRSEVRPPVVLGEDGSRPEGLAGPGGGGRLFGVYAGITAYPTQGELYGCADDARLLGRAMREAHLQDERDQLVLPDGLATRDAFLSGITQIAQQATADDVVLVFFSGHGQQEPDQEDGDELDGLDETIVFFDGSMRDDDVVNALSTIQAGTVILALDSCHAGGFADDWVQRPGRLGVFSSDEDVLSDTAQPHQAGGYLSWHLRRGVLGEADSRPRDGVLHAGELTDYLYDGFVADHRRMNPGEMEPSQRLVVRRGSVTWDQVLWVYPRNPDLSLPDLPDVPLTSGG